MSKTYCLLNHKLTQNQIKELNEKFSCSEIIYPPENVKDFWAQIPTFENLSDVDFSLLFKWLENAKKDDLLLVQGEFGSTVLIVDFALKKELIPIHSVTKRIAKEERNGEIVERHYVFEHVCFRRYQYYLEK